MSFSVVSWIVVQFFSDGLEMLIRLNHYEQSVNLNPHLMAGWASTRHPGSGPERISPTSV